MPDEDVDPQQTAEDRSGPQPAVVARMMPQLRLTQAGNGVALLASLCSVAAVYTYPAAGGHSGKDWAISALVASCAMLAICTFQHLVWLRAMASWKGERGDDLGPMTRWSWIVHLVSYAVVLFGLWACIAGSVAAGATATASALLAFALLFLVLAQVLAGVQYVRTSGPPGTIPAYLRRLFEAIERRR